MPSILNEAVGWLDRADPSAGGSWVTDPSARKMVLERAESFDRLARAAAAPTAARRRELATKDQETEDFSHALEGGGFEPVWGFSCQVVVFG
jgi:hypothetical protein